MNNGSVGGRQPGYNPDENVRAGVPPTGSHIPVMSSPKDAASLNGSTLMGSEHSASESKDFLTTKPLEIPVTKIWRGDLESKEKQMGSEEKQVGSEKEQVGRNVVYDSGYNGINGVPGAQSQIFTTETTGKCFLCSSLHLQGKSLRGMSL